MGELVTWKYREYPMVPNGPSGRFGRIGWLAFVGRAYVGTVWADGDASFGNIVGHIFRRFGSPHLAALALTDYVAKGGR